MLKLRAALLAAAFLVVVARPGHAQLFWDINGTTGGSSTGGDATGTWNSTNTFWTTDGLNGTTATTAWDAVNTPVAVFAAVGDSSGYTVHLADAETASGITFSDSGVTLDSTGGTLTLASTVTNPIPTITVTPAQATITAPITGVAGLTTAGGGLLLLSSTANSYTGATTIGSGSKLQLGAAGVIPDSSVLTMPNGNVNSGFLLNGNDETVRSISSGGTTNTNSGKIVLGGNTLTINDQTGDTNTYTGLYSSTATGKIVKNGDGTLILNNFPTATDFTGEFVVNSGTVGIGQNNVFGANGANSKVTINGGTLKLTGSGGNGSNWGNKFTDIAGSFTMDTQTANTQLTGNGGNMVITLKAANPTITVLGNNTSGVFIFAGPVGDEGQARGFTKAGAGILTVTAANNTWTGVTTVLEGTLRVAKGTIGAAGSPGIGDGRIGDGTGRIDLSGGTLDYNGSLCNGGGCATPLETVRTLTVPNPINVTADSVINYLSTTANLTDTTDPTGVTFVMSSNAVTGTGGKLTFRHEGTSQGIKFRPTFSGNGFNFGRPVTIDNGAGTTRKTILQSSNSTGTQTWSGAIDGSGSFRRMTGGTTVLSGANTFTGGAIVDGGTLTVTGASATFGSGDVTVNAGNAAISVSVANAILDTARLTLLGGGAGGTADVGFLALAAGINERIGSLVLGVGSPITSGTYGASGSGAANINNEYFSGTGIVTVGVAGLPGDFNSDGKVDAGDYATWRKNDGPNGPLANDGGAGTQAARFTLWRANFGNPPGAGSGGGLGSGGAVPEPGTLSLLICALGSLVTSKRALRRRRS